MKKYIINIGECTDDSIFLVSGFSVARESSGETFRDCYKKFRMKLPFVKNGRVVVGIRILTDRENSKIHISLTDHIEALILKGADWEDYYFQIDLKNTIQSEPFIICGEIDCDPMSPPGFQYRISQVVVESLDEEELILPEYADKDKISQYPVKLLNSYRTYHEIRKMGPVYKCRADKYCYSAEKKIFFGDIHIHSNYSPCGYPYNGTIDDNAAIAKENGLDFIAFTDHSEAMDHNTWNKYFEDINKAQKKYDLLIIPAIEWTSFEYGHRNVYFLNGKPTFFNSRIFETNHPKKLLSFLETNNIEAFAAAHHSAYISHLTDFNSIQPEFESLIEIYSTWGNSESYNAPGEDTPCAMPGCHVRDALAKGFKLGFVGGGDVHNTPPGAGGLTAVLADKLSLESIYDAVKNRLCYATTNDRILLDFHINGFPMGSVIKVNQYSIEKLFPLDVAASTVCTSPVERLELIFNGEVIYTKKLREKKTEIDFYLSIGKLSTPYRIENKMDVHLVNCSRYYYIRVIQSDGSIAWSSPIWIDFVPEYDV